MRAKWLQNGLAVVVGCVLAGPSPAEASTVTVVSGGECDTAVYDCNGFPTPLPVVTYEASAAEPNALELSFADGAVALRDVGAVLSAGPACSSVSAHEATCRPGEVAEVGAADFLVRLGDVADTFAVVGPFRLTTRVDAGPGDDVVSGGQGRDFLNGGVGDDRLAGGEGADELTGASGRDALQGGDGEDVLFAAEPEASPDVYDGGEGRDTVSYIGRPIAVTAALRERGAGGAEGEDDVFTGVENLAGGSGDDRLTGDDGENVLAGDRGSDRLDGGPGPDKLFGGEGQDEIRAGAGNDTISGEGSARDGDRVFCGPGVDTVVNAGAADVLSRDCERVDLGFVSEDVTMRPYPISVRRGVARFVVPCSSRSGCRGTIRLRRAAPRAFTSRRRGRITVAVPLPRTGTLVRVNVALTLRGDDGESSRVAYTLRMPR